MKFALSEAEVNLVADTPRAGNPLSISRSRDGEVERKFAETAAANLFISALLRNILLSFNSVKFFEPKYLNKPSGSAPRKTPTVESVSIKSVRFSPCRRFNSARCDLSLS